MPNSLAILGAGRVGRALGRLLRERGWRILVVASRSEATASKRQNSFARDVPSRESLIMSSPPEPSS